MGQKRTERLELPVRKHPAVSVNLGMWVRVWVSPGFENLSKQTKTPADRSLWEFFMELLSRFELETSSLPRMRSTD